VIAVSDIEIHGPLLLGIGALLILFELAPAAPKLARALASALCIFLWARYVWWRYEYAMPTGQLPWQQVWAWIFFFFESLSIFGSMMVLFFMSRHRDRSSEVRHHLSSPLLGAPVDVFIATYNEPFDVLERTILGACAVDHSDLRVWVLDDGARDWVRDFAKRLGVEYVRRLDRRHAKAGNLNNGLRHALSTGRRPQFLLLLDADFVPHRNILKRTLGFFDGPDVGIVQTPQHFFNPDPIQTNLKCERIWPDEQRFFFNTLLACKDAWGAAFCCGTSAVFRVDALVAAGGMATETVTEDMLTTFRLEEYGYRTIFLNEMLSMGLAPESLKEHVGQRSRWCLGAIQQIYTRWSFFGVARIGIMSRLSFFDGVVDWIANSTFKLMMISGPLIYWWTGTAVISSTIDDLIFWLAPAVVCPILYMGFYARLRIMPVMTDVSQLISSFAILRTVAVGLVRPFGHPFIVTAKGISSEKKIVQWNLLLPFAALALATAVGMAINTSRYSPLYGTDGYSVNVFWSIFNIAVLVLASLTCIELPRHRRDVRFQSAEAATLSLSSGEQLPCTVRDISLGGAKLAVSFQEIATGQKGLLDLGHDFTIPVEAVRTMPGLLAVKFAHDEATRQKLIVKLFTGGYENEIREIRASRVLRIIAQRLLT
jgi:cellulose synthase (UDP-forming)